jgi:AcrR family transcriptional regulator
MLYPAKTNAQTILAAAIERLELDGEEALSMRELASRLGISPRALYRYYPDRAALKAALAAEGFHRLRSALVDAVSMHVGKDALGAGATASLAFAQVHPAWYSLLMNVHERTPGLLQAEHKMWDFVVGLVENAVGQEIAASAAVAL